MITGSAPTAPTIELLTSPWAETFYDLVRLAQEELLIVSPFLGGEPLRKIVEIVNGKQSASRVHIVTNLAMDSLLGGSLDVAALLNLARSIPTWAITYLPSLHAKVYVADTRAAVITSANLTTGGLIGNREYGVLVIDPSVVSKVRTDVVRYASLGNSVSLDTLTALTKATSDLRAIRQEADRSVRKQLRAAFEERVEATRLELLKARARGKTTHGVFSDTVLYLLEEKGPLSTVQLHPLIQQIHPDLCDDTIDRVIDGMHFGKKWKHYVRNAQQALRRRELIDTDGQRWFRK